MTNSFKYLKDDEIPLLRNVDIIGIQKEIQDRSRVIFKRFI